MSKEAIESVIGKMMLDADFREAFAASPDQVLTGFDLTETEKASLKSMDVETMDALAHTLDERINKRRMGPLRM